MGQDERVVVFDNDLQIEAYRFNGIMQKFPNHFHEYYVIGFVERGRRRLNCKNEEYTINTGDVVLFNPMDNHTCAQIDDRPLDWRCLNVKNEVMKEAVKEITGEDLLPEFTVTVIRNAGLGLRLKELHELVLNKQKSLKKEELFYFLLEELIEKYTAPAEKSLQDISAEIKKACEFMENNYAENISLDDLSVVTGLNKYTMLRYFTRQLGITPYQYLEAVRVNQAKKRLEDSISPMDAAMECGFADQSHFTRYFKNYIGLTPKQYQNVFREKRQL